MTEKGVGGLPDAGTIKPGDPGHIATHDRMAEMIQAAADANGIILDPPVPPPAVPGENGHVEAHNTLLANIEQLAAEGANISGGTVNWAAPAQATGAVNTHSHPTADGMFWDVYEFSGTGTLTTPVDGGGLIDVLVVGGGGGSIKDGGAASAGGGGCVRWGAFFINENDTYRVTVGAGGSGAPRDGNKSEIDRVLKSGGGGQGRAATVPGYYSVPGNGGGGSPGGFRHSKAGVTEGTGAGGGVYSGDNKAGIPLDYTGTNVNYGTSRTSGAGRAKTGEGGGYDNHLNGGGGVVVMRVKVETPSFHFKSASVEAVTAHAARIEDGIVRQVIVIPHLDDDDQKITEYCNRIGLPGTWVDTSYTGSRRGKYAGLGDKFVPTKAGGEFVSPVLEDISTADLDGETE